MRGQHLRSLWTSAARNLALEEFVLRRQREDEVTLVTYANREAIIIGRNQNQHLECNVPFIEHNGVPLVRRHSGGGTVYHGPGNICFSIHTSRERYSPSTSIAVVAKALHSLGVPVETGRRHDLWVGGKKVSGSAFRITHGGAYHHGTLLLYADLPRLRDCLSVGEYNKQYMVSKGVRSVRSPVVNLTEAFPHADLSLPSLERALRDSLATTYPPSRRASPYRISVGMTCRVMWLRTSPVLRVKRTF
eukprot:Sspe_Gene.63221::Locus_36004_Transcript_2_2_Confidence_0.667_Length_903::g.63221::m.63221/K03800/lplA, lplJ; lipoate---protein ligase